MVVGEGAGERARKPPGSNDKLWLKNNGNDGWDASCEHTEQRPWMICLLNVATTTATTEWTDENMV